MKGLLSVHFGTSYADTRAKAIDPIDTELAAAFPDRAFYSAWTSPRIIAKVRAERDEHHDTLERAFEKMSSDGVNDLVVATTCLLNGGEMKKIVAATRNWASTDGRSARLGLPLLSSEDDFEAVAVAIEDEFPNLGDNEVLLLMGHGTTVASNKIYDDMQRVLMQRGRTNFIVATVEGTPTFDDALARIQSIRPKRVVLTPMMIVAGDHARNDMAGAGDDSWKTRLEAQGFDCEPVFKGLGEYAAVQKLVVDHARAAETAASVGSNEA